MEHQICTPPKETVKDASSGISGPDKPKEAGWSFEELQRYREAWRRRLKKEENERKGLRRDALRVAEKLKEMLVQDYSVRKVVLYGSVLFEEKFARGSDIDLAVEGLQKERYFEALARLQSESLFEVDLKPMEELRGLIREHIEGGKVLYVKNP